MLFHIDNQYTKWDIYKLLAVPESKQHGAWDTGYREYGGEIYIFTNIDTPGTTGHQYNNYWDGDELVWYTKPNRSLFDSLTDRSITKHLLTRTHNKAPFTYERNFAAKTSTDDSPSQIIWKKISNPIQYSQQLDTWRALVSKSPPQSTNEIQRPAGCVSNIMVCLAKFVDSTLTSMVRPVANTYMYTILNPSR